jgi:hypothetical protein
MERCVGWLGGQLFDLARRKEDDGPTVSTFCLDFGHEAMGFHGNFEIKPDPRSGTNLDHRNLLPAIK